MIASASAINELRESLEEEGVSEIKVAGPVASFTVTTEDGTAYPFTATFKEHGAASLACPSRAPRGLAKANGKLAAKSSLAKAVAAAGRCVAVDLEWVFEAEGDGACRHSARPDLQAPFPRCNRASSCVRPHPDMVTSCTWQRHCIIARARHAQVAAMPAPYRKPMPPPCRRLQAEAAMRRWRMPRMAAAATRRTGRRMRCCGSGQSGWSSELGACRAGAAGRTVRQRCLGALLERQPPLGTLSGTATPGFAQGARQQRLGRAWCWVVHAHALTACLYTGWPSRLPPAGRVERVEREIEEKEEFTDISGDLDALQQRQVGAGGRADAWLGAWLAGRWLARCTARHRRSRRQPVPRADTRLASPPARL